jgi:hypothetical protein
MLKSLERFGFQESIISWIKTLYTNIKGCISDNRWISEPYTIERGIKQVCPLRSLIFITAVEILANGIRNEKQIRGFEIKLTGSNHSIKISQLADCKEKIENITLTKDMVKCLGGHFGHDISKCQQSNIEKQLQKTKEIINNWNKRNVSILGNITVMKSLLLPNITYTASVCTIPKEYIQRFKTMIYRNDCTKSGSLRFSQFSGC